MDRGLGDLLGIVRLQNVRTNLPCPYTVTCARSPSRGSNGSIALGLNVCNDWALRSWILSFGPLARVISPSTLAETIFDQLEEARDGYAPQLDFEIPARMFNLGDQPTLPLERKTPARS
jgi:hypothetical protein